MMRILVTGATGFVGAHVLQRLSTENASLAILVRAGSNTWRIKPLLSSVSAIVGDLRNPRELAPAIADFEPDTVIHLAWSGVGNRYRNVQWQMDDNLASSIDLLRTAHAAGCRTWIGLGSQAEYGPMNGPVDEECPTQPTTMYGAAKLAACVLSRQVCALFGMRFVWLRLFSAYGPMDDSGWMIPSVILSLLRGERPAMTEGTQRWDYLFATDVADAICRTALNADVSGVFNLGSGQAHTVRSVAERIRDLIDPSRPLGFGEVAYRKDQVMHLQADISRLQVATGWSPSVTLAEGLARTVRWYRGRQGPCNS
jgi:UDP-glucose 4-epimerase